MYNKRKYMSGKIGSILSIVLGAFMLVGFLISICSIPGACTIGNKCSDSSIDLPRLDVSILFVFGLILRVIFGIVFFINGYSTVGKPESVYSSKTRAVAWKYSAKKKDITLIVLSSIFFAGPIVVLFLFYAYFGMVEIIMNCIQIGLCLAIMIFKIIALKIKG